MACNFLNGKKCKVCGKLIFPTPQWVYKNYNPKNGLSYFCSWSCYKKGQSKKWEIKKQDEY